MRSNKKPIPVYCVISFSVGHQMLTFNLGKFANIPNRNFKLRPPLRHHEGNELNYTGKLNKNLKQKTHMSKHVGLKITNCLLDRLPLQLKG